MTDAELAAIEARAERALAAPPEELLSHVNCTDIPALIAEVRRLRAAAEEEREAWTDAARQCLTENARKELFRLALARGGK